MDVNTIGYAGRVRAGGRFAVILVALVAIAACGSPSTGGSPSAGRSPAPQPTRAPASPAPSAEPTPLPGHATAEEAAVAGIQASGDGACATFPGTQDLLESSVGVFSYSVGGGTCGPGGHVQIVWVYRDGGGWHPYTWAGTQENSFPANHWGAVIPMDTGGGCVNVRSGPSTSASIESCAGTSVRVVPAADSHQPWHPPVWADGYIWWYVFTYESGNAADTQATPLGWVVLDYLVCGSGPRSLNASCS